MNDLDKNILKVELRNLIANYSSKKAIDEIIILIEKEKDKFKQQVLAYFEHLEGR